MLRIRIVNGAFLSALMVFAIMLSTIIIDLPTASAGGVISTPGGTTINVVSGQTFLLRHELYFDQPSYGATFVIALSWDSPSSDENFVLENRPSVYWISGPESGLPVENVRWENVPVGVPIGTKWQVGVWIPVHDENDNPIKNYIDGHFNVDIWLLAASPDGTPHRLDNQQLNYGLGIGVYENSLGNVHVDNVIVNVIPANTSIRLASSQMDPPFLYGIYNACVNAHLKVSQGDNLHLIFLEQDNKTVESDTVIWSRTAPGAQTVNLDNLIVPHDTALVGLGHPTDYVKRVKLVLTDSSGTVVLDNMAWYTVVQGDWGDRISWIVKNWALHSPSNQDKLGDEINQIVLNWALVPSGPRD